MPHPNLSRADVAITWDVPTQDLAHQVAALNDQADRIAQHVQGLPCRDDYDALVAENEYLRENIRALTLIATRQNSSITDLCTAVQIIKARTEPLGLSEQEERLARMFEDMNRKGIAS